MPLPNWNKPIFSNSSTISLPSIETEDFSTPHSNFVNFFQDLDACIPFLHNQDSQYSSILAAIALLRTTSSSQLRTVEVIEEEEDRLMALFYIAIILKDSQNRHFDLSWLDTSLLMTQDVWSNSAKWLRWFLVQGMGRGPSNWNAIEKTKKLHSVANSLRENENMRMEDRLLNIIIGDGVEEEKVFSIE